MDRDEAINRIKVALKKRSGKAWSVVGGRGTAYGWISINVPPKRRCWHYMTTEHPEPPCEGAFYCGSTATPNHLIANKTITSYQNDYHAQEIVEKGGYIRFTWEVFCPDQEFGHMSPFEREELAKLLGKETIHHQGESIPASKEYREEYVARAEGTEIPVFGEPYWD